jgi:hypothetical protein
MRVTTKGISVKDVSQIQLKDLESLMKKTTVAGTLQGLRDFYTSTTLLLQALAPFDRAQLLFTLDESKFNEITKTGKLRDDIADYIEILLNEAAGVPPPFIPILTRFYPINQEGSNCYAFKEKRV